LEGLLAAIDVVPKTLHQADLRLDLTNLGLRAFDGTWVLELLGVELELIGGVDEALDLAIDVRE
jgi:hypothetical protein